MNASYKIAKTLEYLDLQHISLDFYVTYIVNRGWTRFDAI